MKPAAEHRRSLVVFGPDPWGEGAWNALAQRTALELSGQGAPDSIRVGMLGSPEKTAYGDLGPLQGTGPLSHGAPAAFPALNAAQALPATTSPVAGSTDLKALVGSFGL